MSEPHDVRSLESWLFAFSRSSLEYRRQRSFEPESLCDGHVMLTHGFHQGSAVKRPIPVRMPIRRSLTSNSRASIRAMHHLNQPDPGGPLHGTRLDAENSVWAQGSSVARYPNGSTAKECEVDGISGDKKMPYVIPIMGAHDHRRNKMISAIPS
jgi:hypothetical protein